MEWKLWEYLSYFCRPFINGIKLPLPTHLRTMKLNLIFPRKKVVLLFIGLTALTHLFAERNQSIGPETVNFFDGSSLIGSLQSIESKGNLVWRHKSSQDPLSFDYNAVDSVLFNRIVARTSKPAGQLRVKFNNNDFLRGTMTSLDSEELVFSTRFEQTMRAKLSDLTSIEFLPHHIKFCMIHHTISKNGKRAIQRLGRRKR